MRLPYVSTTSVVLMLTGAEAGVHTLPLTRRTWAVYWNGPHDPSEDYRHSNQIPLNSPSAHLFVPDENDSLFTNISRAARKETKLTDPWDDMNNYFMNVYTTSIGVGNPPVNFTASIDTSWSTMIVPSVNCTYKPTEIKNCNRHNLYNSSLSSSYRADLTPANVAYQAWPAGGYTWGNVSQDNIHVGGMEVKGQMFEEATLWRGYSVVDTVLGLSLFPTHNGDRHDDFMTPSLLHSMTKQGLLDENIVSLKLARSDHEKGEMVLGGLPENLWLDKMIVVPLDHSKTEHSNEIWRYYTMGGWQVSLQNMTIVSDSAQTSTTVLHKQHIAIVSSSFPWIGVPNRLFESIQEALGMSKEKEFEWVHCAKRSSLPDITFAFGPRGQEITLTPWDYLIEAYDKAWRRWKCVSPFYTLGKDHGFIILGLPFLNGLHSIWDADRKSISFINRPF